MSGNFTFYVVLGFLFCINFSIAACYILFSLVLLQLCVRVATGARGSAKGMAGPVFPVLPGYYKYFLLYILFSLVSTAFSVDPGMSIVDNKEFLVFLLIPVFLLVINSVRRLTISLTVVLTSALLSSLIGIVTTLRQGISLDHRLKGFTSHWMTYSGLLMMVFIFFFVYFFYEKRKKIKMILVPVLLVVLAAILLSLTRSMWVGIAVALGLFIVYYRPRVLYLVPPVLLVLVLLLPGSVKTRLISIFDMNNDTNKDRLYMITTGLNIFNDHPLTGMGPDTIKIAEIYNRYKPAEAQYTNPHLHNNFLHILAERGIFALLALLAAFGSVIFRLARKIKGWKGRPPDPEKMVSVGALFVFIGFLVAGLFEYNFGDSEIKFLLFYFLSIPFLGEAAWGRELDARRK